MVTQPAIFVSIASYRDPDCQNTVNDLFAKAAHPGRVFVGLCLQIAPGTDADCRVSEPRPGQLRVITVDAAESRGACWARSRVQELWQGEEYFFQVDSHMRFVSGWDEKLIAMIGKCAGEKPVLSTYPLEFTPPDHFAPERLVTIRPKGFDEHGVLTQNSDLSPIAKAPALPAPSPFISAGMLFTSGQVVQEVPYDPHLYFTGEEITLGARLWTSGWDIYCPNEVVAYHNYNKQTERPRHWEDKRDWVQLGRISRSRIRHLLGIATREGDDEPHTEMERYGLGSVRTLADYEVFSGLDFKRHLYKGLPLPLPESAPDRDKQIEARRRMFSWIYKESFWGSTESRSGNGSTLAATTPLRTWLPATLDFLGVNILGDAGCGDLNWMKELLKPLRFYFGFEIVPELVEQLRENFRDRSHCFFAETDIVTAVLPACDAILCRDCLTHLNLESALMALRRIRQSGSRYLIATTHSTGQNVWITSGGWHPMDLTAPPFNFPPPRLALSEGKTKSLGVWAIDDLPL